MPQYLVFLSLKSGNGRWRHIRPKLDNFTILQQNKEIPRVHLSRMLGEYLNYDTTHITSWVQQWKTWLKTGANPIHLHLGNPVTHCSFWVHMIPADPPDNLHLANIKFYFPGASDWQQNHKCCRSPCFSKINFVNTWNCPQIKSSLWYANLYKLCCSC